MPFEDMGIMRTIPEMTVVEPCDAVSVREVTKLAKDTYGTWYMRLSRKAAPVIYEDGTEFQVGKANLLRDGKDVTIIAVGYLVAEALKAADALAAEGISATVLNAAKDTGAIVTAENHNVVNGLGSAVASVLALHTPAPLEMVGVQDEFGEVGPISYLAERFKLTAEEIAGKAKKAAGRK